MAKRLPFSSEQYWDACRRNAYKGAWMYTYEAGTTTILKDTWTTATEEVKHPNPIQADANGIFPEIYGAGSYFIKIMNFEKTEIIVEADNIDGSNPIANGPLYVENVAELIIQPLEVGDHVVWYEYEEGTDIGGNAGVVVPEDTGVNDGGFYINLNNGNQVKGLFPAGVNLNQFGSPTGRSLAASLNYGDVVTVTEETEVTVDPDDVQILMKQVGNLNADREIIINIAPGIHTITEPTVINRNLTNVKLLGSEPVQTSINSFLSASGSSGSYSVVLAMSNVNSSQIGSYLHTVTTVGADSEIHRGGWEITSVSGNNATVRNTCRLSSFPTNSITSSVSSILTTVLQYNNCDAFVVSTGKLGFIDNIAVCGNSDSYWSPANVTGTELGTHGFCIGSQTVAVNGKADNANQYGKSGASVASGPNLCISNFDQQGIVTENSGSFWGDFVSSCNNKRRGFYASTASGIRAKHVSACGNYLDGIITDLGGDIYSSSNSCAIGNGGRGALSSQGGSIILDTAFVKFNNRDGVAALSGGVVQITSADISKNKNAGLLGEYGGVIYCNGSEINDNGTYGLYMAFQCTARSNGCTITGNPSADIRSDGSILVISGSTYGSYNVSNYGQIIDGSTVYGGAIITDNLEIIDEGTRKGLNIISTSSGDNMIVGFDTEGDGDFIANYNFRSNDQGFYPETPAEKRLGRNGNEWLEVHSKSLISVAPNGAAYRLSAPNGGGDATWVEV